MSTLIRQENKVFSTEKKNVIHVLIRNEALLIAISPRVNPEKLTSWITSVNAREN